MIPQCAEGKYVQKHGKGYGKNRDHDQGILGNQFIECRVRKKLYGARRGEKSCSDWDAKVCDADTIPYNRKLAREGLLCKVPRCNRKRQHAHNNVAVTCRKCKLGRQ